MIAIFNNEVSFSNIIDIDISMYDEILVSSMSSPEFSVSFAYNFLDQNDPFSIFINAINETNDPVYLTLQDDNAGILADGYVKKWEFNREAYMVTITCKSSLGHWLDQEVSFVNKWYSFSFGSNYAADWIESMLIIFVQDIFYQRLGKPISFYPDVITYIANFIRSKTINTNNYTARISWTYEGKKYGIIKLFSQFLNCKISYWKDNDSFVAIPLSGYSDQAIQITGYVSSVVMERIEQPDQDFDLFNYFRIGLFGSNNHVDLTSEINSLICKQKLPFIEYSNYKIWGYASQIIHTGQTITLDGVNYYVKDISYEFERLNDLKSFNCEAVRFV